MIDSHCHINAAAFDDDRSEVLDRAWESGVQAIVIPDIEPGARHGLKNLVDADPRLYRGVGIHPHHVGEATPQDLADVEAQCHELRVVAIGEIGLDYFYDFCPADIQKAYFREQLRIAKRNDLPVIIHNRESDDDILNILKEEQDGSLRGVLHCFSSDVDVLERALELGMHVSFTGNITFKKSTLDEVVRRVPIDRFMIETDSPYITPVPYRGKRNEPGFVRYVAEKIAEIKGITVQDVITTTTTTAKKFFGLLSICLTAACVAYAQPTRPNEDDFDTDYQYDKVYTIYELDSLSWAKLVKPRTLGFSFNVGSNTLVENQQLTQDFDRNSYTWKTYEPGQGPKVSPSFDGQLYFGFSAYYQLTDRWLVEGSWSTSKNNGPVRYGLPPIVNDLFNLNLYYSLNPYNKVNFLPTFGGVYATTSDGNTVKTDIGVAPGVALGVAIPTPYGIFYPLVTLRFNVMLGTEMDRIVIKHVALGKREDGTYIEPREEPFDVVDGMLREREGLQRVSARKADVSTIYSFVGLSLSFYPNF